MSLSLILFICESAVPPGHSFVPLTFGFPNVEHLGCVHSFPNIFFSKYYYFLNIIIFQLLIFQMLSTSDVSILFPVPVPACLIIFLQEVVKFEFVTQTQILLFIDHSLSIQPWTIESDVVFLHQLIVVLGHNSFQFVHTTWGRQPPVSKSSNWVKCPLALLNYVCVGGWQWWWWRGQSCAYFLM